MYNPSEFGQKSFDKLNKMIKEIINDYYMNHDADNFFRIDQILKVCRNQEWTQEQIPQLIEMQNIIVMG